MSTDGAGSSCKLFVRAAAGIAFHRECTVQESAKKFIAVPKINEKSAEVDSVGHSRTAAEVPAHQQGKGKGRDGEKPAWRVWILRDLQNVRMVFRSSPGEGGLTCSIASFLSKTRASSQNRLSMFIPSSKLVSVGSRWFGS